MSDVQPMWYEQDENIYRGTMRGKYSKSRLPNGKLVDLRLYYMPHSDIEWNEKDPGPLPAPIHRPVHIERIGQLMFLFIRDAYVDVFTAPTAMYDLRLTDEQQERIAHALAA